MPITLRVLFGVVAGCFLVYAGALVWSSCFLVDGVRYFALFDDAMISMRYARHLADGHGLVWNPNERVEGFTNPGWTLIMAMIHLVEQRENYTSLYVQLISVAFLLGTILMTAALALRVVPGKPVVAGVAAAAVAFYFPLNYFSLMGMETGMLAFMVTAAIYLLVRAEEGRRFLWGAWLMLGCAVFVRLDAIIPALALVGASLFVFPARRRQNLLIAGVAIAGSLAVQTVIRLWYYGDPLPNTYYLKMGDVPVLTRTGRGVWVSSRFLFNHFWPLYLVIPFAVIFAMRNVRMAGERLRQLMQTSVTLLVSVVVGQVAYSTYVGGDVWEWFLYANRFIVIAAPALFILLAQFYVFLLGLLPAARRVLDSYPAGSSTVLSILLILQSNWHGGFEFARDQAMLRRAPYGVSDAAAFVAYARQVETSEPAGTTIAIDRAGTLPYFLHDYRFYDILGKADAVIARMPSRNVADPGSLLGNHFVPGHTKWNAVHTIGNLKPDLVIMTVDFMDADFLPPLIQHYKVVEGHGLPGRVYRRDDSM